jgi:hypothetical protein
VAGSGAELVRGRGLRLGVGHATTVWPEASTLGAVGDRGSRREGRLRPVPGALRWQEGEAVVRADGGGAGLQGVQEPRGVRLVHPLSYLGRGEPGDLLHLAGGA